MKRKDSPPPDGSAAPRRVSQRKEVSVAIAVFELEVLAMAAADGEPTAVLVGPGDEPRAVAYAMLMCTAGRALAADPAACIFDEVEEINVAAERAHHPPAPYALRPALAAAGRDGAVACDVRGVARAEHWRRHGRRRDHGRHRHDLGGAG